VRRLSEFVEGKVNSGIVNNVTSRIEWSDVMFEHFEIKRSRTQLSPGMSL